ncbi:MAG: hypothetical protein IPH53_12530 [Flavobacteriales bacterium]|nr:hypothetical protein [Flavobacteriales bacterium]MBK7754708.1 hypothetical protein [Flavobacteriales bacterium]MBK9076026.1 hypothetical protein [Flavobacteriales bacterium]MBK9537202.1 hypothetical protein [Flavobacteriales bacterium]
MVHTLTMELPEDCAPNSSWRAEHGLVKAQVTAGMNASNGLSHTDLSMLLGCDPHEVLGRVLELNHLAHYHNSLNAVEIATLVEELRRAAASGQDGSTSPFNSRRS